MIKNKNDLALKITSELIDKVGNVYDYGYRQGVLDGTYNMLNIIEEAFKESEGDISYMAWKLNKMVDDND